MRVNCPSCGERHALNQVASPVYDPVAPQFAGGLLGALVFSLSRQRRFQCEKCGKLFYSHTIASRLWLTVWILFWLLMGLTLLVWLAAMI